MAADETVTCTFTDALGPPPGLGLLVVHKEVPAAPAPGAEFGFTVTGPGQQGAGGAALPAGALLAGGQSAIFPVAPGTAAYSVAEAVPPGWRLTGARCDNGSGALGAPGTPAASTLTGITVAADAIVTCTFTDALVPTSTPTSTPTATRTPTVTVGPGTPSPPPGPTDTAVPTASPTRSPTATRTPSPAVPGGGGESGRVEPSPSPSPTPAPTETPTPTAPPSPTATATTPPAGVLPQPPVVAPPVPTVPLPTAVAIQTAVAQGTPIPPAVQTQVALTPVPGLPGLPGTGAAAPPPGGAGPAAAALAVVAGALVALRAAPVAERGVLPHSPGPRASARRKAGPPGGPRAVRSGGGSTLALPGRRR